MHYRGDAFFSADGATGVLAARRRQGLERLAAVFDEQYGASAAFGSALRDGFSDLRFTDASRVPFPFARAMREHSTSLGRHGVARPRISGTSTATGRSM